MSALPDAFITSNSGDGKHHVEIKCASMSDLHRWHDAVLTLARSALSGEPKEAGVTVKPLEWVWDTPKKTWDAETVFGKYLVWVISDHACWMRSDWHVGRRAGSTEAEAKAAAQADYEARIRSATVTRPLDPVNETGKTEHVAEPVADSALLPCPWCGGEAHIVEGEESAYVQCRSMKMHRALWYGGDNNAANEVREQWNRRSSSPSTKADVTEGKTEHVTAPAPVVTELQKAARYILPYLRWSISEDSPGHHPTMPSAVAAFEEAFGFTGKTTGELAMAAFVAPSPQSGEGQPVADPKRKHSMTLNLTDEEIAALDALAKKQQLTPWRVLIQGLRHYQLLVNGEPDLGPMMPPLETAGGRAPQLKAFSADVEDNRVLKVHFGEPVTDRHRRWVVDAINTVASSPLVPAVDDARGKALREAIQVANQAAINPPAGWPHDENIAQERGWELAATFIADALRSLAKGE